MRNVFTRLLAVIILAVLLVQGVPVAAMAAGDGSVRLKDGSASLLEFSADKKADGLLYPGDEIFRVYEVTTVHKKPTTLYFYVENIEGANVDPRDDRTEDLRECLEMELVINGEKVYTGKLPDFTRKIAYELDAKETKTEYAITLSLSTDVDNTYISKKLEADFVWEYERDDGKTEVLENPKTGNEFPLQLLLAIMGSALVFLICLFLLGKDRKKEEQV